MPRQNTGWSWSFVGLAPLERRMQIVHVRGNPPGRTPGSGSTTTASLRALRNLAGQSETFFVSGNLKLT